MNKKGILIVISGFSGAGKGTIVKKMIKDYNYSLSISATTRNPRVGEVDGQDYLFISKEKFRNMIDDNNFLEWAEYCDNYYGTPKEFVMDKLNNGQDVILEIEVQGALKVKEQFNEAVLIFLTPPTVKQLSDRLIGRGTEHIDVVNQRLGRAAQEIDIMLEYDYIVINDEIEKCVDDINSIVNAEHSMIKRNSSLYNALKAEFNDTKFYQNNN